MKKGLILLLSALWAFAGEYYYMNGGKKVSLKLLEEPNIRSADKNVTYECFIDDTSQKLCIPNRLLVKFKESADIDGYLERFGLKVLKKYSFGPLYLLEAGSPFEALNAANNLGKMPDIVFAQPDVMKKRRLR